MRALLLAMPDTADVIDYVIRFPNLAIVSLAGNAPAHKVKVLDLVLHKPRIRAAIENAVRTVRPQVVGLSGMTFQFSTLLRVARFIRTLDPSIRIVAGGYHATLMAEDITADPDLPIDFIVRNEGERTFSDLLDTLDAGATNLREIKGLSYRENGAWVHNERRDLLDVATIRLPDRTARLANRFSFFSQSMDVLETSRGCPCDCKFCSITQMYGRSFRPFPIERVMEDLRRIQAAGTKGVFIVDDNITYDTDHFRRVCQAIAANGLDRMEYAVQVSAFGIAKSPALVEDMARANCRYAFVGFESMAQTDLKDMNKPTSPDINRKAAALLRKHNIAVIAGIIAGYADDTDASIRQSMQLFRRLKPDMIYAQYLTPYPKTRLRTEMLAEGLVANTDDFSTYDGFTCNVRTRHLTRDALYRALKREAVKYNFYPDLIWSNYFVRHHFLRFAWSTIKVVLTNAYNLLPARQLAAGLDV